MVVKQHKNGDFYVCSRSDPYKFWIVNKKNTNCNCPKFKYILKGQGKCHHMEEVDEFLRTEQKDVIAEDGFDTFTPDEYKEPISQTDFIEKYGDNAYDFLISTYEIILHHGLVRLLK